MEQYESHLKGMLQKDWLLLLAAIFIGTFIALWLQQIALKYANPAVAQTLIATSLYLCSVFISLKGRS
ncbi:gll3359 protein [Vibrio ishigakensis]|uniref:Gll3359 protein n=1 Tax=Vibrio ishigakensis TaxID=1481914 RepID=A0A0B8PA47_9VIBR|nr:gll3359 protein [Vibrio ishigakensis]